MLLWLRLRFGFSSLGCVEGSIVRGGMKKDGWGMRRVGGKEKDRRRVGRGDLWFCVCWTREGWLDGWCHLLVVNVADVKDS